MAAQYPDHNPLAMVSTVVFFEAPITGFAADHIERMAHMYSEEALAELKEDSPFVMNLNRQFAEIATNLHIISCVTKSSAVKSSEVRTDLMSSQ